MEVTEELMQMKLCRRGAVEKQHASNSQTAEDVKKRFIAGHGRMSIGFVILRSRIFL